MAERNLLIFGVDGGGIWMPPNVTGTPFVPPLSPPTRTPRALEPMTARMAA